MPDLERTVAGLSCRDVLARLSDYLDGDLPAAQRAQVEAHLAGCDWCERFGGRMGRVVEGLRGALGAPEGPDDRVRAALRRRLQEASRSAE